MTTKKQVKDAFALFCKVYGLRTESATTDGSTPGIVYTDSFVKLDHWNGGYRIEIVNPNTSESPFNKDSYRRRPSEMLAFLSGLLAAKVEENFKGIEL